MGEIVNLNKFRKTRVRAESKAEAAQHRVRFGRTGAERDRADAEAARAARAADAKKLGDDPAKP